MKSLIKTLSFILVIILLLTLQQVSFAKRRSACSDNQLSFSNASKKLTKERYEKNPMSYNYVDQYGDYLADLEEPYDDVFICKRWYVHFMNFPITYWIQPCDKVERKQILEALKQYQLYFPMKEVKFESHADLKIMVLPADELRALCGQKKNKKVASRILGCGGPDYRTSQMGANIGRYYKGYLFLKEGVFYVPGGKTVVLHELGHAFGIKGHSKDPKDIMYYALDQWALVTQNSRVKDVPTHLTYRDVNTLYMIYNDWHDKPGSY